MVKQSFFLVPQVFISTRRGAWILSRVGDYGYPLDVSSLSRFQHFLTKICSQSLVNAYLENKMNQRIDHELYGLKPKHRYVPRVGVGREWPRHRNKDCSHRLLVELSLQVR